MSARVSELARLLRSGGQTDEQLAAVLHDAHECDIAAALELLDVRQRARLYRLLGVERLGDVFAYVSDAGKYLRELPQEQAADIVEAMDADDAVDALETVSPELRSALMEKLDPGIAARHPPHLLLSAGRNRQRDEHQLRLHQPPSFRQTGHARAGCTGRGKRQHLHPLRQRRRRIVLWRHRPQGSDRRPRGNRARFAHQPQFPDRARA